MTCSEVFNGARVNTFSSLDADCWSPDVSMSRDIDQLTVVNSEDDSLVPACLPVASLQQHGTALNNGYPQSLLTIQRHQVFFTAHSFLPSYKSTPTVSIYLSGLLLAI